MKQSERIENNAKLRERYQGIVEDVFEEYHFTKPNGIPKQYVMGGVIFMEKKINEDRGFVLTYNDATAVYSLYNSNNKHTVLKSVSFHYSVLENQSIDLRHLKNALRRCIETLFREDALKELERIKELAYIVKRLIEMGGFMVYTEDTPVTVSMVNYDNNDMNRIEIENAALNYAENMGVTLKYYMLKPKFGTIEILPKS